MALSEAQLKQVEDVLFLLKKPAPTPLPAPVNTDDTTHPKNLAARMQLIATDDRFKDLGIGVIDFAGGTASPKVWQWRADKSWRIGSAGKLAILLAAVQLRDDVRKVKALNLISTPADFDSLFETIWKRSGDANVRQIGGSNDAPRISTIFDLSKPKPDFIGADVALDKKKMSDIGYAELKWKDVSALTFWELMNLTGAQSDDVASTACVSEIGVPYMKAVQRAYGLFNPSKGMHMLLSDGYSQLEKKIPVSKATGAPDYRPTTAHEAQRVEDVFFEKSPAGLFPTRSSVEPGSAAALTAYMIAMGQNKLADKDGCDTIKLHLGDKTGLASGGTTTSLIMVGVNNVSPVTRAITKLGILNPTKEQLKKKQVSIRAEFAYVEADGFKFAVLAAGIRPKTVNGNLLIETFIGERLGTEVFKALKDPNP
jgi:hypothetical protein